MKNGGKEIIQLHTKFAEWGNSGESMGPTTGIHEYPFSIMLPDWLPDSMLLGQPDDSIFMRI